MPQPPTLQDTTDGLYNALCKGLNLSNQQFQMIQGVLPVPSSPSGLYNFFDGIPPKSVATLYTSNPVNGLNGNMQIVIDGAKDSFLRGLAEKNYVNPIYWVGGNVAVDPIYAPPFDDLFKQVNAGSTVKIFCDSATADSNISSSWAKSSSSAGVGFWGTSSSAVSKTLNEKASSSRITIDITFDRVAYLQVRPGGWFTSGFFTSQFQNPGNWTNGQPAWDKVFGPQGSCQFLANQSLLANGYTYNVTSYASYSQSDFELIQKSSETNVWPFYTSSSNSQSTQSFNYNSDKTITANVSCKPGSLQIFGMGVVPTTQALGPGLVSRLI